MDVGGIYMKYYNYLGIQNLEAAYASLEGAYPPK
jgi:hypothetical protein